MGTDAAFATLGLAVGAQPIEITRAFRACCRALHPDHGGDRADLEHAVAAYRVLQAAGLVTRERSGESPLMRPFRSPRFGSFGGGFKTPASSRPLIDPTIAYYRALADDLDRAASIVVTPRSVERRTSTRLFADVLEAALQRIAA